MSLHSCQARSKASCARKYATSDLSTDGESHCLPPNRVSRHRYAHRLTTLRETPRTPNRPPLPSGREDRLRRPGVARGDFAGTSRSASPSIPAEPARDSRALLVALSRELQVRARPAHTSCRTRPIHGSVLFASQSESRMNCCAILHSFEAALFRGREDPEQMVHRVSRRTVPRHS